GGVALLRAAKALHGLKAEGDEQIGVDIIKRACEEPLRQIVHNSGTEGAIVIEKVRSNDSPTFGFNAATEEPVRQISGNAGYEGAIVIEKIRSNNENNFGFNAATGQYEDLVKAGVIDPTKVTRSALQHASSISSLMLTTEAMIAEIPERKPAAPAMPGGHGGPDMDY
ncbi:MAG TPA: TCP-1/cpn60 chaperonin family protein, partial [Bryobacteraceae bacterium]|nr:TCP-1/cpn60 chaperonin family protein [Bryobacteraceae bacterium]